MFFDERTPDAALPDEALGSFANVMPVAELNTTGNEDDPSVTDDELEIYFDSNRAGGQGNGDIWVAKRASRSEPFETPTLVAEIASGGDDTGPRITPDGLTMYFGSDRASGGDRDLYVTTRPDRASAWSSPTRITELASIYSESCAVEAEDGLALFFHSARTGNGDIYVAQRAARGQPWTQLSIVAEVSDPTASDGQLWASPDGETLYITSDRAGSAGIDIWFATRANRGEPFGAPQPVDALNTSGEDTDPALTTDQRTIYFVRVIGTDSDIYRATR